MARPTVPTPSSSKAATAKSKKTRKPRPSSNSDPAPDPPPAKRQRIAVGAGAASSVSLVPKYPFEKATSNTRTAGRHALDWLLHPISQADFFDQLFEKAPRLVKPTSGSTSTSESPSPSPTVSTSRFSSLTSVADIKRLVLSGALRYGLDVDVTTYDPQEGRETLNTEHGEPAGAEAWEAFETGGASIRLLRPQVHSDAIYRLCAHLEEFFGSPVGANVYLTPPNSQGFAPHFDDVDAFVCHVAGTKHWRVYEPCKDGVDQLPRRSSIDFDAEDMKQRATAIDAHLTPGAMLYLPRGAVHEARAVPRAAAAADDESDAGANGDRTAADDDGPALHVTVSVLQRTTWADLLEAVAVHAIRSAAAEDVELRRTLPIRLSDVGGTAASATTGEDGASAQARRREDFHETACKLWRRVARTLPSDAAADALLARFQQDRLPPVQFGRRPNQTSAGSDSAPAKGPSDSDADDEVNDGSQRRNFSKQAARLQQDARVRAVGSGTAYIVMDPDGDTEGLPRLVSCTQNTRDRSAEVAGLTCLPEEAEAVHAVLTAYPKAVAVDKIALENAGDRLDLARGLVELGVVEEVKRATNCKQ